MKKTNNILITSLCVFLCSFLLHFTYENIPTFLTSIIAPVNESIFEHMKIIYSAFLIIHLLINFFVKKDNKDNLFLIAIIPFFAIIFYLLLYLPLFILFGENSFISISLLLLVIILEEYVLAKLSTKPFVKIPTKFVALIIIIVYLGFGILTYYPPKNMLFYDMKNHYYGIKNKTPN